MKLKIYKYLFPFALLSILSVIPLQYLKADTGVLKSGCEYYYPPYCFENKEGKADGFSIDLMKEALKAVGEKAEFRVDYWDVLKSDLKEGRLDLLPLVGKTPDREKYYDFTIPYITMHGVIVCRKENFDIKSLTDLKGKKVAVMNGDNTEEYLRRKQTGAEIITTPTFKEALVGLSEGIYDAVVIQNLLAAQLISTLKLRNLKEILPPLSDFRQDFCFAVKIGNKELLNKINEGLSIVIADGTYKRLHAKWFAPIGTVGYKTILVGGDYNYPPWEYVDQNGNPSGFVVELTKAIAREMDLDVKFYFSDWSDVMEKLRNGNINVVQGMFYSEDRTEEFSFSIPYYSVTQTAVTRSSEPEIKNVTDLDSLIVIVEKDDIMHEYAKKIKVKEIIETDNPEEALRLLSEGKGDCVLIGRAIAENIISTEKIKGLLINKITFESYDYCYGARKEDEGLLNVFDDGLNRLKNTGEYRKIKNRWFGISPEERRTNFVKYAAAVITILIILLLTFLIISFTLNRAVKIRTQALLEENKKRADAEKELLENKHFLDRLLETIPVPVFYKDNEGKFILVNNALEIFERKHRDVMIGKTPSQSFRENEAEKYMLYDNELKAKGDTRIYELETADEDGNVRHIIVHKVLQTDREGKIRGIVGIIIDITQIRKTEEEMRNIDRLSSLGVFAGGIAHDFNNLLAGIMGYLELISSYAPVEGKAGFFAEEAVKIVEQASKLSQQLLTFSSGGKPNKRIFSPEPLIRSVAEFILRGSDSSLDIEISPSLLNIEADEGQISQVISNIIINAVQAKKSNLAVKIRAENTVVDEKTPTLEAGEYVKITIKDNGPGIDAKHLSKIFDPYYSTKKKGHGLGLAVVFSIIAKHGGSIYAENDPNGGAVFVILLPASRGKTDSVNETSANKTKQERTEKILVMDDEKIITDTAKEILLYEGYKVDTADNGQEALAKYSDSIKKGSPYDVVILDLTVHGGMGGKETAESILRIDPDAKLIVSSGYSDDAVVSEYEKYGFKGAVAKPYRGRILAAEIERVLNSKKS